MPSRIEAFATASRAMQAMATRIPENFADPSADYRAVRETMAPFHNHPVSPATLVDIVQLGGLDCGRYRPRDDTLDHGAILHIHGGALVSCPLAVYHFYGDRVMQRLNREVYMPDYRLAPEAPYPAAIDDCLAAYRGLLATGVAPEHILVIGESCGGGLGLSALIRAQHEGLPMPSAFVSLSGWFDLSPAGTHRVPDLFLAPKWVHNRALEFTAGRVALDDPMVSPAYATPEELRKLPPLFLQIGQYDTMAPGALTLAQRATLAGAQVYMESWPNMVQGWHGLIDFDVPEAAQAWQRVREFVDHQLGNPG